MTYRTRSRSKQKNDLGTDTDLDLDENKHRKVVNRTKKSRKLAYTVDSNSTNSKKVKQDARKETLKKKRGRSKKNDTRFKRSKGHTAKTGAKTRNVNMVISELVQKKHYVPKGNQRQCENCHWTLSSQAALRRHTFQCHPVYYLRWIKGQYLLKSACETSWKHYSYTVSMNGSQMFLCKLCNKALKIGSAMALHHRRNHVQQSPQKLHWIRFYRKKMQLLKGTRNMAVQCKTEYAAAELDSETSQEQNKCMKCEKLFRDRTTLLEHARVCPSKLKAKAQNRKVSVLEDFTYYHVMLLNQII